MNTKGSLSYSQSSGLNKRKGIMNFMMPFLSLFFKCQKLLSQAFSSSSISM